MANCKMDGALPYNCENCDLRGQKLQGKDLTQANFKKANLSGLDLSGMDLSGADLSGAILTKTLLKNSVLLSTKFVKASWEESPDFSGAKMGQGTDFSGLDLRNTLFGDALATAEGKDAINLSDAKISFKAMGKRWRGLNLTRTDISDLPEDISRFSVKECTLNHFDFSKKKAAGISFEACSLEKAKFQDCNLTNASFIRSTNLTDADFSKAILELAVLDGATLDNANFRGTCLKDSSFLHAKMVGTIFETDVTEATFSNPPRFSRDASNLTSFKGAKLNVLMLSKEWSFLDLRNATLVGLDPAKDFSNLRAEGANLSGYNFSFYKLDDANFSRAKLDNCVFDDAQLSRANFRGAIGKRVNFRRAVLFNANFSSIGSAGEQPSTFLGVDFSAAVLSKADFAWARMGPSIDEKNKSDIKNSLFVGARMEYMGLNKADLRRANLTGGVSLHDSILTSAWLQEANLTGVQMGGYATLFVVDEKNNETKYEAFLTNLNSNKRNEIKKIFKEKMGADVLDKPEVTVTVINYAWTIKDGTTVFTVVRWMASDNTVALVVSKEAGAATLSEANLRSAVLRDADLRGVTAHGADLSGSETKLGGTKLDGIKLVKAHMQGIDLTDAKLYGADLTGANLIGADFQRAVMQKAILGSAWLQGAKFLDTDLNGVLLGGAAVSLHITADKAGVYLLTMDPAKPADPKLPEELRLLTAEISLLSKQYVLKDSDKKLLDTEKLHDLQFSDTNNIEFSSKARAAKDRESSEDLLDAGKLRDLRFFGTNKIEFSSKATVVKHRKKKAWIITDGETQYRAWCTEDWRGEDIIYIRAMNAPALTEFFNKKLKIPLQEHFSIRRVNDSRWEQDSDAESSVNDSKWELDNDAESNPDAGYAKFGLIKLQSGAIALYATASRMMEKNDEKGISRLVTTTYKATVLCSNGAASNCEPRDTVFGQETICPNARRFRENLRDDISWLDMLRAIPAA